MMKSKTKKRSMGKVSQKMAQLSIVKVSCGPVRGKLHKNKFYCPGIHRECIEYNGKFITPKLFSVMGDKEKLKDWKNAIRINGLQVRKYIESGALDFYRHEEFCTGRCIARSPVSREATYAKTNEETDKQPTGTTVSVNEHTYCHLPSSTTDMQTWDSQLQQDKSTAGEEQQESQAEETPSSVDVKPSVALLQSLLEKPRTSTNMNEPVYLDDFSPLKANRDLEDVATNFDGVSEEEDRQFWLGIMELGLLEHFFKEIRLNIDTRKRDLIQRKVLTKDAVMVSNMVRSLGLMKCFQLRLAKFKSEMDQQQDKIDQEMEELKKRVTMFELRKQALKVKADKFEQLMDMSKVKKEFTIETNQESSDDEDSSGEEEEMDDVEVYFENNEDEDDEPSASSTASSIPFENKVTVPSTGLPELNKAPVEQQTKKVEGPVRYGNITTLPADSSNNFVFTSSLGTNLRQVLLDGAPDAKEKLITAAAKAKAGGQGLISSNLPVAGAPKTESVSGNSSPVKAKGKIKIIARYKPIMKPAASKLSMMGASTAGKTTGIFAPTWSATAKPKSNVVSVDKKQEVSTPNTKVHNMAEAKVVVEELFVKRKPGPRCKTMFPVNMGSENKLMLPESAVIKTFGGPCQIQVDTRENRVVVPMEETTVESSEKIAQIRKSSRKTMHMFSWGINDGDNISENTSTSNVEVEKLSPEELLNYTYQRSGEPVPSGNGSGLDSWELEETDCIE